MGKHLACGGAFIPPFQGGVSRGSVRVGVVKTFLLPSYGFSFGYKRKGVSFAEVTSAQRDIVGHSVCICFHLQCAKRTRTLFVFCRRKAATKSSSPCKQGESRRLRRCAPACATALIGQGFSPSVICFCRRQKQMTALPPRRSPLVLRLFALALADGSGLPFSLHPPPAALESQTPQREPRRRCAPQRTDLPPCESSTLHSQHFTLTTDHRPLFHPV